MEVRVGAKNFSCSDLINAAKNFFSCGVSCTPICNFIICKVIYFFKKLYVDKLNESFKVTYFTIVYLEIFMKKIGNQNKNIGIHPKLPFFRYLISIIKKFDARQIWRSDSDLA